MKIFRSKHITLTVLDSSKTKSIEPDQKMARLFGRLLKQVEQNWSAIFKTTLSSFDVHLHLSLTLCGAAKIKKLNSEFRQKDKITDVLSFQMHPALFEGQNRKMLKGINDIELGDIIVCREVATKQAKEFKISYQAEVIHLFIHGFLHLIGYDHENSQKDEVIMQNKEKLLIEGLL